MPDVVNYASLSQIIDCGVMIHN